MSSNATNINMTLLATTTMQRINSTSMHYIEGAPDKREYDACHYVLVAEQTECASGDCKQHTEAHGVRSILFRLNKAVNIDVYFWEGESRGMSVKSIYNYNKPPVIGKVYDVAFSSGFFIVTVPKKDMNETELDF